ncbi:MAG: PhnD/SsuA/transferrin family substrate-binding protein [Planctomycetota bacterium]|jgi:hypothetical protein|nr:PhnD/SsuA/transferrin family substrate-binding protein [Planctomycetota bacterium]
MILMTRALIVFVIGGFFAGFPVCDAEEIELFFVHPGGPGSTEEAASFMSELCTYLSEKSGIPAEQLRGRYDNDEKRCLERLKQPGVRMAVVSLGFYLRHRQEFTHQILLTPKVFGHSTERFYLLSRKGAAQELDAYTGKILSSSFLDDTQFVDGVVFRGRFRVDQDFRIDFQKRSLRAIKAVTRGKSDLVLLNQLQFNTLEKLRYYKDLQLIWESEPVPHGPVIRVGSEKSLPQMESLRAALIDMGNEDRGRKLLETMQLEGFLTCDPEAYETVVGHYLGNPGPKDSDPQKK